MSTRSWRRLLLALCAIGLLQLGTTVWTQGWKFAAVPGLVANIGLPGQSASLDPTATPFVRRIAFAPSNPLARDGVQSGDLIDFRGLPSAQRYRLETQWWWVGERAELPVIRNGVTRKIALMPKQYPFPFEWIVVGNTGLAWLLFFAGIIAARRSDSPEARVLALLLILFEIGLTFQEQNWISPWPEVDAALNAFSWFVFAGGISLLATYTMLFAQPASWPRRVAAALSYASAAVAGTMYFLQFAGMWTLTLDTAPWYTGWLTQILVYVIPALVPLACVAFTLPALRGAERDRFIWSTAPLAFLYLMITLPLLPTLFDADAIVPQWVQYISNFGIFLAPLGLTYSLLNRRVLDLGFAINRAVVFSGVSVVIVGIFVLVEWVLSEWFRSASHTTDLAINAGLALVLGLSVRGIHYRVDRVLDTVFFRKRHEDEHALRTFAHEAAYITDAATLVDRAKDALQDHADASFVDIVLDDHINDPAMVAMRAWRKVLDLHTVRTALQGEFAYPMVARGRLLGAIVLGPKRSGESYAPDESAAILQLAHGVGGALDVLSVKGEEGRDRVLEAIAALAEQMRELRAALTDGVRAG
jgi:hypothetical protein